MIVEHHIQKDILLRLSKAPSLRFSELKPNGLESNAFMYHLKQLQSQKLVDKIDEGYRLSDDGLAYIDSFSFNTLALRKQPKVISILAIHSDTGKWLVAKRKYQPYINQYMLPSGKQHLGEGPAEHAERELIEKIGIELPLTRRGMSDIRIYHGDKLITHVLAHIYQGESREASLPAETHQFSFAWEATSTAHKLLAGTREIMEKLENETGLFFLSLDVQDK